MSEIKIGNKFIFTDEGRRMLTAQLNGIRFAVLGAILVQGVEPVELDETDTEIPNPLNEEGKSNGNFFNKMRGLNLEDLIKTPGVMIGMKDIDYIAQGNEKINVEDLNKYKDALNEIEKHVLPLYYIPSQEMQDKFGNVYGTYNFEFDRTTIPVAWPPEDDVSVSFAHLCLIGKQYAETNDATFNVNKTQRPVIVGVAQLDGVYHDDTKIFEGGAQLLKEQNKYLATKIMLRFTLDENDYDIGTTLDVEKQEVKEVMDVAKKLSLVNNGLKTIADENVTMKIAGDNTVVEELGLNPDGKALATSKTLMVADTYRVDKLDNQWNAAGLVHIINKEDVDNDTYKQQIILTTLEHYEDLSEELTAYNTELFLRGKTTETNYAEIYNPYLVQTSASGSSGSIPTTLSAQGQDAPIFKMDAVPENDRYAVEIFGYENNYFGYNNIDKTIFSNNNITFNPGSITDETLDDTDGNILFNSNYNYINGANLDNMLINADYNYMDNVLSNMLIGADANIIKDNAAGNILFGTNFCTIEGSNTTSNIIIGGTEHRIKNSKNIFMLGKEGLLSQNKDSAVLFGEWNKDTTNAGLIYGIGTSEDNRQNAMEFFPGNGKLVLYKNNGADVAVVLGGKNAIEVPDDVEVSFKKLHVNRVDVDSYFIVGEAQGFGYSDYGAYIRYNSASKNTDFVITVPGAAGASLTYSTDNQTFSISDNHPYSRNADFVSFNNEYASFTKAVDYTSDRGPYIEHSILIHQDIANDLQKSKTPGVLTVFEEDAGGLHSESTYNKVNIYGDKIVFSELNTETFEWEETKTIDKGETYNKIAADVHVWGPGISDWSMDMRNYRGSKHYKKWLNNIWNLAPPVMYSDGNDRPTTNGAYVSIYDTARGEFRNIYFDENGDSGDENAFTEYAAAIANAGPSKLVRDADDDKYLKYYTEVPDGLDEIEINLYMHNYSDKDIGLIWLPLVDESSEKVPQIIINLFMDNMDSGGEDIFAWNAKNYGEEQKPEFDNIRDVDKCKFIQLRCTPAKGTIYTGPTRDGHSNSCGWWPCD